jgi:hypothetical protein
MGIETAIIATTRGCIKYILEGNKNNESTVKYMAFLMTICHKMRLPSAFYEQRPEESQHRGELGARASVKSGS